MFAYIIASSKIDAALRSANRGDYRRTADLMIEAYERFMTVRRFAITPARRDSLTERCLAIQTWATESIRNICGEEVESEAIADVKSLREGNTPDAYRGKITSLRETWNDFPIGALKEVYLRADAIHCVVLMVQIGV